MATWHLIYQQGDLPTSVVRADGVSEVPPAGLIRYLELADGRGGPWTTEPATDPLAIEAVEWPHPCVWAEVTGCTGTMVFVEHINELIVMNGEPCHPSGWQCELCGKNEVGGFAVLTSEWQDPPESN